MADKNQSLSGQESLDIIHQMINRARGSVTSSAFHILLWGWIIVGGSLGHFLLLQYSGVAHPEWAWAVISVGIAGSVVQGIRNRKDTGASTYPGNLMAVIWATFLVNYFIMVIFIAKINFFITPVVLALAASSIFLSGTILKYRPIKWGAIFVWLMSIVAFLVALPYQLLATAAAMIVGYLIPGYMLKKSGE